MNKITIIDGNSLLFRAYYATIDYRDPTKIMKNSNGIPTNAIFAFSNMILKILNSIKINDHLLVVFDTGNKTFRHVDDDDYKANRKAAPEELVVQFPIAREFLKSLNIPTYELDGYEADDLAGTVAKLAEKDLMEVEIYTSDRDYLQLISDLTTIKIIRKGLSDIVDFNERTFVEEYSFPSSYMIDFKALVGDTSDNIKGVPGVGPKTAAKLINEYGHLNAIIENVDSIKGKVGESIKENRDIAKHAHFLATIKCDVEIPFALSDTRYQGYEKATIIAFANKYELRQMIQRLPLPINDENSQLTYQTLESTEGLTFTDNFSFAFLLHDESNYFSSDIEGLFFNLASHNYFINKENLLKDKMLLSVLESENISKFTYDYKRQKVCLSKFNITLKGLAYDILLAAYLIDSNIKDDVSAVFSVLDIPLCDEKDKQKIALYCANFAKEKQILIDQKLEKISSLSIYKDVEIPLNDVLARMEIEGFPLHLDVLNKIGDEFKKILDEIVKEIYLLAGYEFNINSPKQIAVLLFDNLHLPETKKRSTSADALDKLSTYPIVAKILEHRKYAKLISTYIEGLTSSLHPDQKIHSCFNQALTTTGRLSSSNPNMQNISIRDEEGRSIRKAFFYDEDEYVILSYDYSQIELRLLASNAKCQPLIETFNNGYDVHQATADALFGVLAHEHDARRKAKAVNFGIVYGISDWGLSEQLNVSVGEAKEIINNFYLNFPEIATFRNSIINDVSKNGYVTTLINRRRYINEIFDTSYQVREFAKRAATNAPIQGSAADLIKIAMIKVDEYLSKNNFKSKLVLQIHDELVFKLHKDEETILLPTIKEIMENALDIDVKLNVEASLGKTWFEAK